MKINFKEKIMWILQQWINTPILQKCHKKTKLVNIQIETMSIYPRCCLTIVNKLSSFTPWTWRAPISQSSFENLTWNKKHMPFYNNDTKVSQWMLKNLVLHTIDAFSFLGNTLILSLPLNFYVWTFGTKKDWYYNWKIKRRKNKLLPRYKWWLDWVLCSWVPHFVNVPHW